MPESQFDRTKPLHLLLKWFYAPLVMMCVCVIATRNSEKKVARDAGQEINTHILIT
jgi:hypothetical protein